MALFTHLEWSGCKKAKRSRGRMYPAELVPREFQVRHRSTTVERTKIRGWGRSGGCDPYHDHVDIKTNLAGWFKIGWLRGSHSSFRGQFGKE